MRTKLINQSYPALRVPECEEIFSEEPDPEERWTALKPVLAELLADPEVIAASKQWPDCEPRDAQRRDDRGAGAL